jgi:hypothetical protein
VVVVMTARRVVSVPLVVLFFGSAPAQAQTGGASPQAPSGAAPALAGAASFRTAGGLATAKARYYVPRQQAVLRGRVKPAVAGEIVTLYAIRDGKRSKRIRRVVGDDGRFQFRFRVGKPGLVRLVVKHAASEYQAAFRAPARRIRVVRWRAGVGASGVRVLLLQRALARLGFATPVNGRFDGLTANAVGAFRKTNRMGFGGYANPAVYAKLFRGEGAIKPSYPRAGKHVEFDWSRQVLVLADHGRPYRVYHTSSGKPSTPTVFGTFRFYRKTPGTNALGMVHSSYFIRGYAIHGYASVPNYPASHGCLRVPIPNAAAIYRWIDLGDRIFSYR